MGAALNFLLACFFAIFPIVNPFSAAASRVMGLIILCVGIQLLISGPGMVAPRVFPAGAAGDVP